MGNDLNRLTESPWVRWNGVCDSNPERPEGSRSIGQRLVDGLRATTYLEMIAMFGIVLMLASPYFMLIVPLLLVAWLISSHATNRIARKSKQ